MAFGRARSWDWTMLVVALLLPGVSFGKEVPVTHEPEYFYLMQTGPVGIEFYAAEPSPPIKLGWKKPTFPVISRRLPPKLGPLITVGR